MRVAHITEGKAEQTKDRSQGGLLDHPLRSSLLLLRSFSVFISCPQDANTQRREADWLSGGHVTTFWWEEAGHLDGQFHRDCLPWERVYP